MDGLCHFAVLSVDQVPILVVTDRGKKIIGDTHRVIGVLSGDRQIGIRIPICIVGFKLDGGVALARELDDPLDVILGNIMFARGENCCFQRRVRLWIKARGVLTFLASIHDRTKAAIVDA